MPAEQPPPELLATAWRAWIVDFLNRVVDSEIPDGAVWTSWFRTPQENQRVGGAPWSNHLVALGLDAAHRDLGQKVALQVAVNHIRGHPGLIQLHQEA